MANKPKESKAKQPSIGGNEFDSLMRGLVAVPVKELAAEQSKYDATKASRKAKKR